MHVIAERNLRTVDLNLLVVFDALMAERNVTRAAERNGLSQPAVSKALNRLRGLFDDPLFVRRDRGMEPTARALELAGPIHGALADISRTLTLPAAFEPSTVKATVKIATIDLYHTKLLPSLVRQLRQQAPGVDLQVRANDCSQLREQLASGEIDIAFAPLGRKCRAVRRAAVERPAGDARRQRQSAAGADDDRDLRGSRAPRRSRPCAGSPEGVGTSVVDAILAARGLRRHIALVLPNSAGIPFIVAATDLIATLPSRIVKGLLPMSNVRILTPPLPEVEVSPHMFWHRRTHADPLQIWLRAMIREIAADM